MKSTAIAGLATGTMKKNDLNRLTVATAVQKKAVTILDRCEVTEPDSRPFVEEGSGSRSEALPKLWTNGYEVLA